jgi:putative DNA primase/helicase
MLTTANEHSRPVAQPVNIGSIPAVLRGLERWVMWRYVEDVDEDTGEVNWDKPPVNARTGMLASSTNPETWSKFIPTFVAYRLGGLDGVGFVLHVNDGEPAIIAIDLDHCRDPETGVIDDWATDIIRKLNSYTEVSPSGSGIRVFLLGRLPLRGRKKGRYENYETGRYVTVTGQHVDGRPFAIAILSAIGYFIFGSSLPSSSTAHR